MITLEIWENGRFSKAISTTESKRDMTNKKANLDREHFELSFDTWLKKFDLEIMASWQVKIQYFLFQNIESLALSSGQTKNPT